MKESNVTEAYRIAKEQYGEIGVDVEKAIGQLGAIPDFVALLAGR